MDIPCRIQTIRPLDVKGLKQAQQELREAKLVCTTDEGYALTEMGIELSQLLEPFGAWAITWAMEVAPEEAERWNELRSKRLT